MILLRLKFDLFCYGGTIIALPSHHDQYNKLLYVRNTCSRSIMPQSHGMQITQLNEFPDFYQYHGVFGNMGGLRVYQSSPPPNTPTCGTLLLLPDGFGLARHNLILADSFAQEGWSTVVPDYFEGMGEL